MSSPADTVPSLDEAAERLVSSKKRAILLVEDNAAHAALIRRSIDQNIWNIEHVTRASSALQSFSKDPERIVLLDLSLPDSSGLELLSNLLALRKNTAVIIVTSLEEVQTSVEAMRRGAWDYVVKGDPQETGIRIRDAIDRAYTRRLAQAEQDLIEQARILQLVRTERLEAIELIVRTVCHEVNNPLSGVVALSQLLGERSKEIEPELRSLAEGILNSAQEVARVVKKLHHVGDNVTEFGGKRVLELPPERPSKTVV